MQGERAFEIISSSLNIGVTFQGKPVWIKSVNKDTNLAEVVVYGSSEKVSASIAQLEETGFVGFPE